MGLKAPANLHYLATGSDALELALHSLNLPPGTLVATPAFACIKVAKAIRRAGLRPYFLDLGRVPNFATPYPIANLPTSVGAVVLVHLYGHLHPETQAIVERARQRGLLLIHDAAQSFGVEEAALQTAAGYFYSFGRQKSAAAAGGARLYLKKPFSNNYAPPLTAAKLAKAQAAMQLVTQLKQTRQQKIGEVALALQGLTGVKLLNPLAEGAPFKIVLHLLHRQESFMSEALARGWPICRLVDELPLQVKRLPQLALLAPQILELPLVTPLTELVEVLTPFCRPLRRRGELWV